MGLDKGRISKPDVRNMAKGARAARVQRNKMVRGELKVDGLFLILIFISISIDIADESKTLYPSCCVQCNLKDRKFPIVLAYIITLGSS